MLLSLGIATSVTTAFFWPMSSWLAVTSVSVCIWKSHMILAWSFSTTFEGVSHVDLGASFQTFLHTMPASWLALHVLPASYNPLLCARLSQGHLCTACIRGPVWHMCWWRGDHKYSKKVLQDGTKQQRTCQVTKSCPVEVRSKPSLKLLQLHADQVALPILSLTRQL